MKPSPIVLPVHAGILAILMLLPLMLCAQTLEDFGYGNMKVNGRAALGNRPLVTILARFGGAPTLAHDKAYFDNLVYNWLTPPSVNGYFQQVSNGRFLWSRPGAGVLGPLDFTEAERTTIRTDDPAGISQIVRRAMVVTGFDFGQYDADHNGVVSADELCILIISNAGQVGGATRAIDPSGCVPYGSQVRICSAVSTLDHRASLMTFCHEISHQLGTLDLYGGDAGLNDHLTLMGPTIFSDLDNRETFHLDPWHKMQLGWSEPARISLPAGGLHDLPAQQLGRADSSMFLYDPAIGTSEFFMLEYRTQTNAGGAFYDKDVTGNGLAIWHIQQDANHNPVLLDPVTYAVFHAGAYTLARGGTTLWPGGSTTPLLSWNNGVQTATKIVVHPFTKGRDTIEVEWLTQADTWVDFNYAGTEKGTFSQPYNTVTEGVFQVYRGGTLKLKAGSTLETFSTQKAMTIEAFNGPVNIGTR